MSESIKKLEWELLSSDGGGNITIDPKWEQITFINSISISKDKKTINYITKTMNILTYGDAVTEEKSFSIE